jgi:hypothetical protein
MGWRSDGEGGHFVTYCIVSVPYKVNCDSNAKATNRSLFRRRTKRKLSLRLQCLATSRRNPREHEDDKKERCEKFQHGVETNQTVFEAGEGDKSNRSNDN